MHPQHAVAVAHFLYKRLSAESNEKSEAGAPEI